MKSNSVQFGSDAKEPFQGDLFGREVFAKVLTSYLRNAEDGTVIMIHGPWGEGKTAFAKMWKSHLAGEGLPSIYFDAFAVDHVDDAFMAFSGEILSFVEKQKVEFPELANRSEDFKRAAIKLGTTLVVVVAKVAVRSLTAGALNITDFHPSEESAREIEKSLSESVEREVAKRLNSYSKEKGIREKFRAELQSLAACYQAEFKFPLTIIVDELDRCRPDFAISLLEGIKHFFDVPDVAFVLLLNREQIENYVRKVYGSEVDSGSYLLKFVNLFWDLPLSVQKKTAGFESYCRKLFEKHGISLPANFASAERFIHGAALLSEHFQLSLREMDKIFCILEVYYISYTANTFTDSDYIFLLSIIKIRFPTLYRRISNRQIEAAEFLKETKLSDLKTTGAGIQAQGFLEELKSLLGSGAPQRREVYQRFGMDHTRVLEFLCSQIDRSYLL